jgi:hypothetical protein
MQRALVLLGLLPVAIGACAQTSADTRSSTSADATAIRKQVRAGLREATDGTAARTCRYISEAGQMRMITAYNFSYQRHFRSCQRIVRFERRIDPDSVEDARHVLIRKPTVEGDQASVLVAKRGKYGPAYHLYMSRYGDTWKIDNSDVLPAGR